MQSGIFNGMASQAGWRCTTMHTHKAMAKSSEREPEEREREKERKKKKRRAARRSAVNGRLAMGRD